MRILREFGMQSCDESLLVFLPLDDGMEDDEEYIDMFSVRYTSLQTLLYCMLVESMLSVTCIAFFIRIYSCILHAFCMLHAEVMKACVTAFMALVLNYSDSIILYPCHYIPLSKISFVLSVFMLKMMSNKPCYTEICGRCKGCIKQY